MPDAEFVDSDPNDKAWYRWKRFQSWYRAHLSALLSAILAVLVVFREVMGLVGNNPRWLSILTLVLISATTVGTFFAAMWEIWWNKGKKSHQEVEFINCCSAALDALDRLLGAEDDDRSDDERMKEFTQAIVNVSSIALSACFETDAGIMFKRPGGKSIYLACSSYDANYEPNLEIPLPTQEWDKLQPGDTGPAGLSYDKACLVYVPIKSSKRAFAFKRKNQGSKVEFRYQDPVECWVETKSPIHEDFSSVLCVPVVGHRSTTKKQRFGVLNFTTKETDPFDPRHFVIAECFAKIEAIAKRWEARGGRKRKTGP